MRKVFIYIGVAAIALVTLALAGSSVSRVPPLTGTLLSLDGEPLPGAYMAYRHRGYRFNFVDSLTYTRKGDTLRTDEAARYHVPGFIELHPPLDSGLEPWIEWVYVPELHHFFGPISYQSESRPGVMVYDTDPGVIRLADVTDDPRAWARTIGELDGIVHISHRESGTGHERYALPDSIRDALQVHLREEFRAFMRHHEKTPRAFPETPSWNLLSQEERQARRQQALEDLEREPTWGQLMARKWPELMAP